MRHSRSTPHSGGPRSNRTFRLLALLVLPLSLLIPIEFANRTSDVGQAASGTVIAQASQKPGTTDSQSAGLASVGMIVKDDRSQPTPVNSQEPTLSASPTTAATPTISGNLSQGESGTPAGSSIASPLTTATAVATTVETPPSATNFVVYNDALASGWWDQSWDAKLNYANTNPVYAGSNSIRYTATAGWAGLDLRAGTSLSTAAYAQLRLVVRASQANQEFAVYLRDATGASLTKVPLANFGGTPPVGSWQVYTIPLSDLGAEDITIGDIVVHEWSGNAQPAIFIDSIELLGRTTTQDATFPIYDDALTAGWMTTASWNVTVDTNHSSPVYAGSKSISDIATAGWAGLQLSNDTNVDTSPYTVLRFAVRSTKNDEPLAIYLRDKNGKNLTNPISLVYYGGYPVADGWTVYTIPLSDLGARGRSFNGIVFHNWSSSAQSAMYIDSIELVNLPLPVSR